MARCVFTGELLIVSECDSSLSTKNKYSAQTGRRRGRGGQRRHLSVRKDRYPWRVNLRFCVRVRSRPPSLPLPPPSLPWPCGLQSYGFSLGITSSRGFAPPKMAELGLATWLSGSETVRGFSCSRGRCARSSATDTQKQTVSAHKNFLF